nr:enoyl-CoA hydratase/isomerase family protein [Pseudonocardia sp. SCN 73-27]
MNCLTLGGMRRLREQIESAASACEAKTTHARPLCVSSSSAHFCCGADLQWLRSASASHRSMFIDEYLVLSEAIATYPGLTIGLADGPVVGGGVGLAAGLRVTIGTPRATFRLPELALGGIPALALPPIVRRIGSRAFTAIALTAELLDPSRARDIGLLDVVVHDRAAGSRTAAQLSRRAGSTTGALFEAVNNYLRSPEEYRVVATEIARGQWSEVDTAVRHE